MTSVSLEVYVRPISISGAQKWIVHCFQIRKVMIIKNKITKYNQLDNLTKFLCIQKIIDRENIIK